MEPTILSLSVIEVRLVSRPALACVALTSVTVPPRAHSDLPLEIAIEFSSSRPDAAAAAYVARRIAARGLVSLVVEETGVPRARVVVSLSVRPSDRGWVARALIDPASWAGATSVTVEPFSVAGRRLPSDCLPATVQVGYNRTSVLLSKAVRRYASGGSLLAELKAALTAGGLTDDVDEVRGENSS